MWMDYKLEGPITTRMTPCSFKISVIPVDQEENYAPKIHEDIKIPNKLPYIIEHSGVPLRLPNQIMVPPGGPSPDATKLNKARKTLAAARISKYFFCFSFNGTHH